MLPSRLKSAPPLVPAPHICVVGADMPARTRAPILPTRGGPGLQRKQLGSVRKSLASRYYQLLSGHAAIGPFLCERMVGMQRLESRECWWCNCGRRQSRHHLLVERKAWALQIKRLWERAGKDREWGQPRAPAVRLLWDVGAGVSREHEGGVQDSDESARAKGGGGQVSGDEGEGGGPGPP